MQELYVLWTNADLVTTEEMVFLYTVNAKKKGWFDSVTLIIWGATATLTAQNKTIQEKIKAMIDEGVDVRACKKCADDVGATSNLEALGVTVEYYGVPLTEILKDPNKRFLSV